MDGRRLRREHNREAVLEALIGLFEKGRYTPTSRQIAEVAGLSLRSLVRYFDDVDDLTSSAIRRIEQRALPLVDLVVDDRAPTDEKVRAIVASRVRLYDAVAPAARAGRVCAHRQPAVAEAISRNRRFLRHQIAALFAPELERSGPELLAAADVLLSFESYDLLRAAQGRSQAATTSALEAGLQRLLQRGADPSPGSGATSLRVSRPRDPRAATPGRRPRRDPPGAGGGR